MKGKFFLASHPVPKIEGEMIIFKPKKSDQTQGKDVIVYRDFSLRKRIETVAKIPTLENTVVGKKGGKPLSKKPDDKEKEKEVVEEPGLNCLMIDSYDPLTKDEWSNFTEVVTETQGLGWFQILPVGQKSSMPYQFNMLHILPQAKIPVAKLPMDVFISNYSGLLKKKEQSQGNKGNMTAAQIGRQMTAREEMEEFAIQQGLIMIPEFQFDHAIYQI